MLGNILKLQNIICIYTTELRLQAVHPSITLMLFNVILTLKTFLATTYFIVGSTVRSKQGIRQF